MHCHNVLLLPLLTTCVLGCGPKNSTASDPQDAAPELAKLTEAERKASVAAVNRFGAALLPLVADASENALIAPHNIHTTLLMVALGARGETLNEFAQALEVPALDASAHRAFASLYQDANRLAESNDPKLPDLKLANAVWPQRGLEIIPEFRSGLRDWYRATLTDADFRAAPETARREINQWVASQTADRIQELLGEGVVDQNTRLVLVSAVYFKGKWKTPFDSRHTRAGSFTLGSGKARQTSYMHANDRFGYAEVDGAQLLELPYEGDALSMVIVLPRAADGLAKTRAAAPQRLTEWLAALHSEQVRVSLPRFSFRDAMSLNEPLQKLGLQAAFSGAADFSGINGQRDLALTAVVHQTFVEVNEEGTEAAGATGAVIGRTSIEPRIKTFDASHPFLFLIRDRVTGLVLFFGQLAEPTERLES